MQWFRFYAEALNDPKVQSLDGETFKVWVNLLCVTSQCDGVIHFDDISFHLRMSDQQALDYCRELADRGLLDIHENGYVPHGWQKRQFKSDTSAERTKKYRERKKERECDVTSNVTVTPPDTEQIQNRTEQNREERDIRPSDDPNFEIFWDNFPKQRRGSRTKAEAAFRQALKRAPVEEILSSVERYATSDEVAKGFAKGAAAWLNDDRWTCDYSPPKIRNNAEMELMEATARAVQNFGGMR